MSLLINIVLATEKPKITKQPAVSREPAVQLGTPSSYTSTPHQVVQLTVDRHKARVQPSIFICKSSPWEDDKLNTDCGQWRRSRGIKSKSCNAKIIVKSISVRSGYHQFVEVPSPDSPSVSPLLRTVSTRGCEGEETIPVILLIVHQLEGTSYQEINSEEDGRFRIIWEFRKIAKIKTKDIS